MASDAPLHQRPYEPPPGSVTVTLIRHGASAPVVPGRRQPMLDGQGNPPLDPIGVEQAERTAEALCRPDRYPFEAIYCSTMVRTQQTAEPLAQRTGLTPVVLADLREVYLGDLEGGLLREAVATGDPIFEQTMRAERWDTIPGAESEEAFSERLARGLAVAVEGRVDQRVALVVHGGVIARMLADLTGASNFAFKGADNASVSEFVLLEDGRRWLRSYNIRYW